MAVEGKPAAFNLPNGNGFLVREVFNVVSKVGKCGPEVEEEPRREG